MSSGIARQVNIYRQIDRKLVALPKLFDPLDLVAALFERLDDRIGTGEVAGADGDEDRARLAHPAFDPFRPIGVALADQGGAQVRGGRQVSVEGPRNALDVAAGPGVEHAAKFLLHRV